MTIPKYIDIPRARELYRYDPESGDLIRLVTRGKGAKGQAAGSIDKKGYKVVRIDGRHHFFAHRVAWALMTGEQPDGEIDHINGDKADNRWANLRVVNRSENMQNTDFGDSRGVTWHNHTQKWQARIKINGKSKYLGVFKRREDALMACQQARSKYHPAYARD